MDVYASPAVVVRQVRFGYGFGKSKVEILRGFNLNADAGTIYAILGPSGCGKTTLLRCIVGSLDCKHGLISVFGQRPGQRKSLIPGSGVGYMPQELALYEDLNIEENLYFYGRLHNMDQSFLKSRIKYLIRFLNLPNGKRLAGQLSGGEKRRVSFAITVLHEPPLIILDEPTVGMDPLLRESIWHHLKQMCGPGKVTIILTTHHVEEAVQANKIGLMRNGKTLAEGKPEELRSRFHLPHLDDVYLKLCREDSEQNATEAAENGKSNGQLIHFRKPSNTLQQTCSIEHIPETTRLQTLDWKNFFTPQSLRRITTLTSKNFIKMKRSTLLLIFQFLLPLIQILAFGLLNGDFHHVPVAVCNEDTFYGSRFLKEINNNTIHLLHVDSMNAGVNLVLNGQAVAAVHIWDNFSTSLMERFGTREKNLSTDFIQASSIHMRYDTTNLLMTQFLYDIFSDTALVFARKQAGNLKKYPRLLVTLIQAGDPIYGRPKSTIKDFLGAAFIVGLAFLQAAGLSSVLVITDKTGGLLDRNYVAGVTSLEIMCGHVLTQFGVIVIQIGIFIVFAVEVFDVTNHGSILLIIILSVISGVAGMGFGFLISAICNDAVSAIMLSVSIILPNYFISGLMVSLASANGFLQFISPILPLNLAFESIRWIMLRGRGISWSPVWIGFLVMIAWLGIFVTLSLIVIYLKRRF